MLLARTREMAHASHCCRETRRNMMLRHYGKIKSDLERRSQHIPASMFWVVPIQGCLVKLCNELLHPARSSRSPLDAGSMQAMQHMSQNRVKHQIASLEMVATDVHAHRSRTSAMVGRRRTSRVSMNSSSASSPGNCATAACMRQWHANAPMTSQSDDKIAATIM